MGWAPTPAVGDARRPRAPLAHTRSSATILPMRPSLVVGLLVSACALAGSGCVNGARSGMPVAPAAASPAAPSAAPSVPPPPPPTSATPPAAPTVWRAEYYTISDG